MNSFSLGFGIGALCMGASIGIVALGWWAGWLVDRLFRWYDDRPITRTERTDYHA